MRLIASVLLLCSALSCGPVLADDANALAPMATNLKPRQPNWRMQVIETHPDGQPHKLVFFEQVAKDREEPVRQIIFYDNGLVKTEMDVARVAEDSAAAQEWKSTIVPHGMALFK